MNNVTENATSLFIRRWGEMAASWGVSRTMAEIHALLFLSIKPLCTDDVMEQLAVSRGSASTNLRELVKWGLIERVHQRGDRKEYFVAETDVWAMFETISRERRRREVEPIVETIQKCIAMLEEQGGSMDGDERLEACRKRFADMLNFFALLNNAFNMMSRGGLVGIQALIAGAPKG
ncbi:MAG: GbsR/MarR family transcriptional regulator [Planctomycetota bacterium]|jgi:DNA-binding transcriptional regulator GbsR (MarR family)